MKNNLLVYKKILKNTLTFLFPIEKEVLRINKDWKEIANIISYTLKFIDSTRFMGSSSSNIVDGPAEGIHRIHCEYGNDNKKIWNLQS